VNRLTCLPGVLSGSIHIGNEFFLRKVNRFTCFLGIVCKSIHTSNKTSQIFKESMHKWIA